MKKEVRPELVVGLVTCFLWLKRLELPCSPLNLVSLVLMIDIQQWTTKL